jgi:endonuclease YncB( thermonuclease family)
MLWLRVAALALIVTMPTAPALAHSAPPVYRVAKVADGDTITLANGQRVRFVQIDTPEVYFGAECYGHAASLRTKRLLPIGTRVRLLVEPATDRVDQYGRLLRYVIRLRDGLNVNVRLVAVGAAAPYFYGGRRGRYASRLELWPDTLERSISASGAPARTPPTTRTAELRLLAEGHPRLRFRAAGHRARTHVRASGQRMSDRQPFRHGRDSTLRRASAKRRAVRTHRGFGIGVLRPSREAARHRRRGNDAARPDAEEARPEGVGVACGPGVDARDRRRRPTPRRPRPSTRQRSGRYWPRPPRRTSSS